MSNQFIESLRQCHPNEQVRAVRANVVASASTLVRDWDALVAELEMAQREAAQWERIALKLSDTVTG